MDTIKNKLVYYWLPLIVLSSCSAVAIMALFDMTSKRSTFTTSLTFSVTNRLAVTHYVIIPATSGDWAAMTSRYPAHVTKTVLNFK